MSLCVVNGKQCVCGDGTPCDAVMQLTAERDALQRDAKRYQYLRDGSIFYAGLTMGVVCGYTGLRRSLSPYDFDAAIDHELQKLKQGNESVTPKEAPLPCPFCGEPPVVNE